MIYYLKWRTARTNGVLTLGHKVVGRKGHVVRRRILWDVTNQGDDIPRSVQAVQARHAIHRWVARRDVAIGWLRGGGKQGKAKGSGKKKGGKRVKQPGATSYVLRVSDFVPMAQAIATAEEQVMVPVALTKLFNRAIRTRRKVANWFKLKDDADQESNSRHHYFITVLEDAFKVLRPFTSRGPQPARSGAQADASASIPFENRFANLTVEEAAEFADEFESSEAGLPEVAKVVLEQDETDLEEELRLAISLLLQELGNMGTVVRGNWQKYRNGDIDLIVAAMVTDTAIQLAQKAEAEFDLVVPRSTKYPSLTFPVGKLLPSRYVRDLFSHNSRYIASIFAVQMLLDSQDVLGDKCGSPCFELTLHLNNLIRRFNQVAKSDGPFLPDKIKENAYTDYSGFYESLIDVQNWVLDKGFEVQFTKLARNPRVASHPLLKKLRTDEDYKNYVLAKNPLLCGMMKYDLYLRYHVAGLRHEYRSLSICMMSHVYITGLLQNNSSNPVWPDMEQVIYAQDPEWLFVGGLPKTLKEAATKFHIVCGSPATNKARDVAIRNMKMNVHKLRDFRETRVFAEGVYLPDSADRVRTDALIKRLLEAMRGVYPRSRLAKHFVSTQNPEAIFSSEKLFREKLLTPEVILENFAIWLQADMTDLYFDCDPRFPRFLDMAYELIMDAIDAETEQDRNQAEGDCCILTVAAYHQAAAKVFSNPGPLHISTLYKNWLVNKWKPRWDTYKTDAGTYGQQGKEGLRRMMHDQMFQSLGRDNGGVGAAGPTKLMQQSTRDIVAPYLDHIIGSMEKFNLVPETLCKARAVRIRHR
ncbi:hypothetical protein BDV96DRAFT_593660 [Lophiotrema nucula]|uniref:DUF6604 domain-containing protein n=1 Tax=Lophiotrema nucula TaxID=690887 RepID=A0A6A5ZU39_9PLEO|nr:hypothetical protein BDV96DRAFT_593660 [Lophiotrema nucula]